MAGACDLRQECVCARKCVCVLGLAGGRLFRSSRSRVRVGHEGREVSGAQMKAHYNDISFRQL